MNKFPIQLVNIGVGEIHCTSSGFPLSSVCPIESYNLSIGHSDYEPASGKIQITVNFESIDDASKETINTDFKLVVRIHGEFEAIDDKDTFDTEKMGKWASTNGIAILLPFLRDIIYTLTSKSGYKPFILPLMEIPMWGATKPSSDKLKRPQQTALNIE